MIFIIAQKAIVSITILFVDILPSYLRSSETNGPTFSSSKKDNSITARAKQWTMSTERAVLCYLPAIPGKCASNDRLRWNRISEVLIRHWQHLSRLLKWCVLRYFRALGSMFSLDRKKASCWHIQGSGCLRKLFFHYLYRKRRAVSYFGWWVETITEVNLTLLLVLFLLKRTKTWRFI